MGMDEVMMHTSAVKPSVVVPVPAVGSESPRDPKYVHIHGSIEKNIQEMLLLRNNYTFNFTTNRQRKLARNPPYLDPPPNGCELCAILGILLKPYLY